MERLLIFLLFFGVLYSKEYNGTHDSKKYEISDVISLIKSSKTKGYKIIDPNDYIKKENEKILTKTLEDIYEKHKIYSFIIIFDSAYLKDDNYYDIDLSGYCELLKDEIYNQKIVGKNDPIIVSVITIDGKIMSMKTQGSVSQIITEQDCNNIMSIINNYLKYREYSYGSVELGKLINYYLENISFFSRNKRLIYMVLLLIICFVFCYLLSVIAQKIKDRRNLRLTMSDEEKLLKIREFLKKTRANRKILSDNCIICLEPFDNCRSITHTISHENQLLTKKATEILIDTENDRKRNTNLNTNANTDRAMQMEMETINDNRNSTITDNQISTLPCGHRYHVKCITERMLQRKNICPMCRERIDVDIPDNDDEDLQNVLLNIQIDLHPAFALLVFQTINEELTWGAMSLPALNGGFFSSLFGLTFF